MGDIVMGLAIEYAKARGLTEITDKALEYAYETLGIEPEEEEYTGGGIYGMKNAFSPKNLMQSLGRNVLSNAATKAISGSGLTSMLGPAALIGGTLMLGRAFDPTRPGSRNYNPALAGQLADLGRRGIIGHDPNTGIYGKIMSGPLQGKNLISLFGTNDYGKMLDKKVDWFEDRITSGKNYSEKGYREAKNEAITEAGIGVNIDGVTMSGADYQGGTTNGGTTGSKSSSSRSSRHGSGPGGLHSYSRGGIANINMNRGQLGETLYG